MTPDGTDSESRLPPPAKPPAGEPPAPAAGAPVAARRAWLIAAGILAMAYLAGVNDSWAVKPDSGLYLALGRALAEGRGMEFDGVQMWAIPPGLPLLVAACLAVTPDHYWLINLVLHLMALGTAVVASATAWRLGDDLPPERRGLLTLAVLLVVGLSARLFVDASQILTDVPFSFFVALGVYGFVRAGRGHWAWAMAGSAALLAATMTRLLGPLFFLGAAVAAAAPGRRAFALLRRQGRLAAGPHAFAGASMAPGRRGLLLALLAGGLLLVAGTWFWMAAVRSQADPQSPDYLAAVSAEQFNLLSGRLWVQVVKGLARLPAAACKALVGQELAWVNLVPAALIVFGWVTAARRRQWIAVLPPVFYIGFLLVWGHAAVAARYFLPVLPMLAYGLLLGADELGHVRRTPWLPRAAPVVIATALCLAVSLPKVARHVYWMRHPQFYAVYDHGKWKDAVDLGRHLAARGRSEADGVITPDPTLVHYLSRLRVWTRPLWERCRPWEAEAIPPDAFAEAAVRSGMRFVVVPTDVEGWSGLVAERLAQAGVYEAPRREFGRLALYERRPGAK